MMLAGLDTEKKKEAFGGMCVESIVPAETSKYFTIHKQGQGKTSGDSGIVDTTTTTLLQ
jgi:hypothetical protein